MEKKKKLEANPSTSNMHQIFEQVLKQNKMANAIKKYQNGLSIRFLKTPKKYYITFGVTHIKIDNEYSNGFKTFEDAEKCLLSLKPTKYSNYSWLSA